LAEGEKNKEVQEVKAIKEVKDFWHRTLPAISGASSAL